MQTPPSASALSGRISVAMATYNGERYLPEMLDSLASQTRLPDELVVRDDGSTDGTLAVVRRLRRPCAASRYACCRPVSGWATRRTS